MTIALRALQILVHNIEHYVDGQDLHLFSQIVPKHCLWPARIKHFEKKLNDIKNNATSEYYENPIYNRLFKDFEFSAHKINFKSNPKIKILKHVDGDGIKVCQDDIITIITDENLETLLSNKSLPFDFEAQEFKKLARMYFKYPYNYVLPP